MNLHQIDCTPDQKDWTISSCEHAEQVLKQPDVFRSSNIPHVETTLQGADDPEHARVRKIVARAFSPQQVAALEVHIRSLACGFVDDIVRQGRCNFVADIATPFPMQVMARLLGLDPERSLEFVRWSEAGAADPSINRTRAEQTRIEATQRDMDRYIVDHLKKCRAGQVAGAFSRDVVPDLTDEEATSVIRVLLIAGNVTTTHLFGNMAIVLLQHPALLGNLRKDPELIPAVIEETLRINGPALSVYRRTAKDVELGGRVIPADSRLTVLLGSANHCEDRFPDADRFDLSRNQRHLSFGYGIHFCIGASLSRLEARVLLETLVERCSSIEAAQSLDSIEWDEHAQLRGPKSLALRVIGVDQQPSERLS